MAKRNHLSYSRAGIQADTKAMSHFTISYIPCQHLLTNEKRPDKTNMPGKFSVKNLWVNVSWSTGFHCVLLNVSHYTAEDRVCEFKES